MPDENRENDEVRPHWDELITLQEAAELSGFSYGHLRHLARNGEIWAKKLGRDWFTTRQVVKDYLAQDRRPGPKSK